MLKLIKRPLVLEIIILSIFMAVSHWVFSIYNFYYLIPKLDILMHFLGGLLVGLIVLCLLFVRKLFGFAHTHHGVVISTTLVSVLMVGLAWELFEFMFNISIVNIDTLDTIEDIVMDIIGGLVAIWWYYTMIWNKGE